MPPHRRRTSKEPDQHPEPDDCDGLFLREEGGVNQPPVDERVRAVRQRHRRQSAEHSLERALQQKRAPHEAVGRAHQTHDGDLAAALQHRHADRRADDDDRHSGERRPHDEPHGGRDLAQPIELLHPVAPEPHVVHETKATQALGDVVHVLDVAEAGLELHLDRGGQRIALEFLQHLADDEVHGLAASSRGSSTPESYIRAPSWSSMTRYGAWRTRSRSWVAMTTAVPLALMSRSSWNTPRVARSSRLPVGSSASRTVGSFTSARAIATRCCSPPDSSRG